MNRQAVTLLQEIYTLVRSDAQASSHQSLGQYRSALLREISGRIKTAVGPAVTLLSEVQARAAEGGSSVEICYVNAEGEIQLLKPLTIDQARGLVKEIEESISEVITRDASAMLGDSPTR